MFELDLVLDLHYFKILLVLCRDRDLKIITVARIYARIYLCLNYILFVVGVLDCCYFLKILLVLSRDSNYQEIFIFLKFLPLKKHYSTKNQCRNLFVFK